MTHYKVTFDTGIFVLNKLQKISLENLYTAKFRSKFIHPYAVTTSEREKPGITKIEILRNGYGSGLYGVGLYGGNIVKQTNLVPELYAVGFGVIGQAAIGDGQRKAALDNIMNIICANNQWENWDFSNLTDSQRRKFNDALIFECHSHLKHDIFVSDDERSFIHKNESARKKLSDQYATEILMPEEFEYECEISSL